jgi:hypothetical protein
MQRRKHTIRVGFSLLEVQMAFVLLGIALAGLCPLLVIQSKQLRQIESRLNHQTTYYLIPSTDPWARKLGVSASVQTADPGPPAAAPALLMDNGGSGYSESGSGWKNKSSAKALNGSCRTHTAGTGKNSATWTFQGLTVGAYAIEACWPGNAKGASNATYSISDGTQVRATVAASQKTRPNHDQYQGVWWYRLKTVALDTTTLSVTLTDKANGTVYADGMRLIAMSNNVEILLLDHSLTSEDLTAHVSVGTPGP